MNTLIKEEIRKTLQNLKHGLGLITYRPSLRDKVSISHHQVFLLSITFSLIFILGGYLVNLPNPSFSFYGVATLAIHLTFLALYAYCLSHIIGDIRQTIPIYIVLLSIWPFIYLAALLIGQDGFFNYWQFFGTEKFIYTLFNIWILTIVVIAITRLYRLNNKKILLVFISYLLTVAVPLNYVAFGGLWHKYYEEDEEEIVIPVNVEDTYYKQFDLLNNATANLLPERQGVEDLYFVGFGSYADQDVFMKEVQYAQHLLDDKFDTKRRSVVLINNKQTVENTLLASKSNLKHILKHLGTLLNPNEDILFLYLTSHGSKQHQLSVDFWPLDLNSINPTELKSLLDESGIKNRVLLISACYSGGFVEPLKNENTLIFTASAKDKRSFGCGDLNDFTYFGNAVFNEEIKLDFNLVEVFKKAAASIQERENVENKKHSEPQLFIGTDIELKLLELARELEEYDNKQNNSEFLVE